MFSLSTSWNSSRHKNGFDLINEIKQAGFDTVELNFALTEEVVADIYAIKERSEIKVSSLHNMCPLPKEIPPGEASPDYYSLASADEDERRLAVDIAKNTIGTAAKFGARAVVIHAGRVRIEDRTRDLARLVDGGKESSGLRARMIKERNEFKRGCLDSVLSSLKELVPYAKDLEISLGIENRYYYREIPLAEEMEIILSNFRKGDIFYWHDAGHAEVFERLGLIKHTDLLRKFHDRLLGIHLHDIIGAMSDHKVPGQGTFDFSMLKEFITKDTIKVMEVHQPSSAEELRLGVSYLKKIGIYD